MPLLSFAIVGGAPLLTMVAPSEEGRFVSGVTMVKGRTPELGLTSLAGRLLLGGIPCIWRRLLT